MKFFSELMRALRQSPTVDRAAIRDELRKTRQMLFNYTAAEAATTVRMPMYNCVEFAPGCFAKAIELDHNGMSLVVWEIPDAFDIDTHSHSSRESFVVLRGKLEVSAYVGGLKCSRILDPLSEPMVVEPEQLHKGRTFDGDNTIIVTSYVPALSIEEVLVAV